MSDVMLSSEILHCVNRTWDLRVIFIWNFNSKGRIQFERRDSIRKAGFNSKGRIQFESYNVSSFIE